MVEECEYQIDRFVLGPIPAEEFTLAHFGLGDFEAPSSRSPTRFGYYALAVAIAAALVSVALAWFARRTRSERAGGTSTATAANPEGGT